jgi:hypothetical protein
MSVKTLYPTTQPSLLLDFANVKQLDPRVTFVRTTTATYYDGVTTAKAEENLLLQSQEFDNAAWTKVASSVTANADTSPDGTSTAERLIENATNAAHVIQQGFTPINGVSYTFSAFVKAAGRNYAFLGFIGGGVPITFVSIDLVAGTVSTATGTPASSSIQSVGNDWYRVFITSASTGTGPTLVDIRTSTDGVWANRVYTGDGTSGILIWGAQLEQRSSVTAYTPTTTQPITNYIPVLQTAAANVARFDHNPVTGESLGLLIEEQRTNLLTYSEDFTNAYWSVVGGSIAANSTAAPDGALTADTYTESTLNEDHRIATASNVSATVGASYTLSVYAKVKPGSAQRFLMLVFNSGFASPTGCNFDLVSGTVGQSASAIGTITNVGNGWYRCTITPSGTATGSLSLRIRQASVNTSTNITSPASYTGDGYSGIYIWGAQLEAGAFPTSYIPTVAATVTRNADAASMTGANFSSWYRQDEGSIYVEAVNPANIAFAIPYDISDGTTSNEVRVLSNSVGNSPNFSVRVGAVEQCAIAISHTANTPYKSAAAYKANDFSHALNNVLGASDTSGVVPIVDRITIGSRNFANHLNGTIRKLAYYPKRLTNAELQGLTS